MIGVRDGEGDGLGVWMVVHDRRPKGGALRDDPGDGGRLDDWRGRVQTLHGDGQAGGGEAARAALLCGLGTVWAAFRFFFMYTVQDI